MSRNDEIIWEFFQYIVALPEEEYINACNRMSNEGPIPELMKKMIYEADKKRNEISKIYMSN